MQVKVKAKAKAMAMHARWGQVIARCIQLQAFVSRISVYMQAHTISTAVSEQTTPFAQLSVKCLNAPVTAKQLLARHTVLQTAHL